MAKVGRIGLEQVIDSGAGQGGQGVHMLAEHGRGGMAEDVPEHPAANAGNQAEEDAEKSVIPQSRHG